MTAEGLYEEKTPPFRSRRFGDPQGPTALYLLYDHTRELIYAGITANLERRFATHKCRSPWWDEVVYRAVIWYPSRSAAEAAEDRYIEWMAPRWNKDGPGRQRIGVIFPRELLARVDSAAAATGLTRSQWLCNVADSAAT